MTYDLKSVSLPKLGTTGLRVLTALVESRLTGPALVARLKHDGGLDRIREDVPDDAPTFFPRHPPDARGIPPLREGAAVAAPGFRFPSVDDFTAAYRSGRLTPEGVAERFLAQVDASERGPRPLRAFIATNADDLRIQAAASTERWRSGRPLGPLDGVPVAVKDEMDQAGFPTTVGTRFLGRAPAREDATVVARMRAAGALLVGKTNMHEIGINVTGLNPHHGTTRNPYDDAYHTGGSSSGPATVVAAGLAPVAIGADGGGSIRIPSAFCGLVGIKATFGRISEFGAAPLCWSVAHIGPMAGSVRDCARAYAIMAGEDARDPQTLGAPPAEIDDRVPVSLDGVRLGMFTPWFRHASADVVARCDALVRALVERGATLHEVALPGLDATRIAHIVTILSEMAAAMQPYDAHHRRDFSLDARLNLAIARSMKGADYANAQRTRSRAIATFERAFSDVHAIVTPATGQTAPRINPAALPHGETDLSTTLEVGRFAFPPNLTGHPAIAIPAGYDAGGLPVGLQLIGRAWSERLLFRIAACAEQVVERRAPQRWYPLLDGAGG